MERTARGQNATPETIGKQMDGWRKAGGGRGRRVPDELRRAVVRSAAVYGVGPVAKAAGLDASRVREWGASIQSVGAAREEVVTIRLAEGVAPPETIAGVERAATGDPGRDSVCVVEVENARGERMRVRLGAGSSLVQVLAAFRGAAGC